MPALRLWQLIDSAFPSGSFTHSGGLEAAVHHGELNTADDLYRVTRESVRQAGYGGLPFVNAAHRSPDELPSLDARADLFLNQPVSNRASRAQGAALLNAALRIFPEAPIGPIANAVGLHLCGHHAPIFGAVFSSLGIHANDTARLFLYQSARLVISAAIRLGVTATFEAQRLQAAMAVEIDRTLESCGALGPDDVAQTAPLLDLYQSTHDRLYSRLFQS